MLTGEIRHQVDRIWDTFWTGGISNPLEVIEQLTYLLFIKRLDEIHTLAESKANMLGKPIEKPIFSAEQQNLRWSRFKNFDPKKLYTTIADQVFPFIKSRDPPSGSQRSQSDTARHRPGRCPAQLRGRHEHR
jgi:type I restriction enzyme M protein